MSTTTTIEDAQTHLRAAFAILQSEGLSEKFFPLAVDTGQQEWGRFFGEFGDDAGLRLEIRKTEVPCEVSISLTVQQKPGSFLQRLWRGITEGWSTFRGKEMSYTIHLSDDKLTKLKDLLRNI